MIWKVQDVILLKLKDLKEIRELGVLYTGLFCGNCPAMFRELAEVYGRTP